MTSDNREQVLAQMRKGVLEMCVLAILSKSDAYSNDIIETLQKNHILMVEGTLYPLLTRMKNQGYLSYRWEESKSGPPRKYFSITEKGKVHLNTLIGIWNEFSHSINKLIKQ
ncbi:PadR family transcriptional regulator [Schleiferia thermophila str. Yellowstone]|uniref:PadR family transcriptional regulator n=2 Tax=Schleiferia thermophila TaxID=884107 RepID=A0A369ACU9_9FLAO|nr:PadR family transcriptional regulator [Schleiferia thermophila str. Yellowstone]RCX05244.1 PadR family transcriptional regulator [Schleiferia thermophila]GCD79245.1 PadR family transcriptional regulator [Schleiferia thermophila]